MSVLIHIYYSVQYSWIISLVGIFNIKNENWDSDKFRGLHETMCRIWKVEVTITFSLGNVQWFFPQPFEVVVNKY